MSSTWDWLRRIRSSSTVEGRNSNGIGCTCRPSTGAGSKSSSEGVQVADELVSLTGVAGEVDRGVHDAAAVRCVLGGPLPELPEGRPDLAGQAVEAVVF